MGHISRGHLCAGGGRFDLNELRVRISKVFSFIGVADIGLINFRRGYIPYNRVNDDK